MNKLFIEDNTASDYDISDLTMSDSDFSMNSGSDSFEVIDETPKTKIFYKKEKTPYLEVDLTDSFLQEYNEIIILHNKNNNLNIPLLKKKKKTTQ